MLTRLIAISVAVGVITASSAAPRLQWRIDAEAVGVPAVDEQHVYFITRQHSVIALDRKTGQLRWSTPTGVTATVPGSRILLVGSYVVAGDYDLIGLSASTGAIQWRFSPQDGYGPGVYLGTAFVSADRAIVVSGSPSGSLYAVDANTGSRLWQYSLNFSHPTTVYEPVVDRSLIVAGYTEFSAPPKGGVIAVATDGSPVWQYRFPDSPAGTAWAGGPLLFDRIVVAAGRDGTIHGLDRDRGSLRWTIRESACLPAGWGTGNFRAMARLGDNAVAGSLNGCVTGYAAQSGRELWHFETSTEGSVGFRMGSNRTQVFAPYSSGRLLVLDGLDGHEVWRVGGDRSLFWAPPAEYEDCLYIAGQHTVEAYCR